VSCFAWAGDTLEQIERVTGGKLLWWPDGSLLQRWGRNAVELLLLCLLELFAISVADPRVGYTPCGTWEEQR
jgi:hypothetical protein